MPRDAQKTVGVLIPVRGSQPTKQPTELPIGRAALHLMSVGVRVVFGEETANGCFFGMEATTEGWVSVSNVLVDAVYDRFPSQKEPAAYERAIHGLNGALVGNPMSLTLFCRDKLKSQRVLEKVVRMPALAVSYTHLTLPTT